MLPYSYQYTRITIQMHLVEKHVIKRNHRYFKEIDNLCFLAKNLYNAANYLIRQSFILEKKYLNYNAIQKLMTGSADYKAMPAKLSQNVDYFVVSPEF